MDIREPKSHYTCIGYYMYIYVGLYSVPRSCGRKNKVSSEESEAEKRKKDEQVKAVIDRQAASIGPWR